MRSKNFTRSAWNTSARFRKCTQSNDHTQLTNCTATIHHALRFRNPLVI